MGRTAGHDTDGPGTAGGVVRLYWIPLGAGATVVRRSGQAFEWLSALLQRRPRCDLYHSALVITVPTGRYVIEMTPIPDGDGVGRGVVSEGAVGSRWGRRLRVFRYEIRRWKEGVLPDADQAVGGPVTVADDLTTASLIVDLVASVPTPVWGRDELHAGEMWNSNSVTAWLLTQGGVDLGLLGCPEGGRAPGWDAGIAVARRGV